MDSTCLPDVDMPIGNFQLHYNSKSFASRLLRSKRQKTYVRNSNDGIFIFTYMFSITHIYFFHNKNVYNNNDQFLINPFY